MPHHPLAFALLVALTLAPGPAAAFSGAGKESWNEALKYLGGGRATAEEAAAIREMTPADRYQKAIDHLLEAERQTATPQETEAVSGALGNTYNRLALSQADAKDYRNASYSMAEAIKRLPSDPVLQWNLGNFQFSAGEYWESAQSFAKARDQAADGDLKLRATRALIQAYMKQAQSNDPNAYDYAIKEIQSALYDHANDLELLYGLGEAYRLKGNGAEALKAWDQARALGPLPAGMEHRYQQLKAAQQIKSDGQFVTSTSLHFKLEFEDKTQSGNASKFEGWFEEAYDVIGEKFSLRPEHKVHVTVYTGEQFNDAVKIPWAGGVQSENKIDLKVNPRGTDEGYKNTILHEYTHHVVMLKAGQKHVPTWLQEGVAMHSEPTLDTKYFLVLLDAVVRKKRAYIPFDKLTHGFTGLPSDTHVRLAYAQSYAVVDLWIERFGMESILKVLAELAGGQEFEPSFQQVTRVAWKDFERQWFEGRQQIADAAAAPAAPASAAMGPAPGGPSFDGLEGRR